MWVGEASTDTTTLTKHQKGHRGAPWLELTPPCMRSSNLPTHLRQKCPIHLQLHINFHFETGQLFCGRLLLSSGYARHWGHRQCMV